MSHSVKKVMIMKQVDHFLFPLTVFLSCFGVALQLELLSPFLIAVANLTLRQIFLRKLLFEVEYWSVSVIFRKAISIRKKRLYLIDIDPVEEFPGKLPLLYFQSL